MMMAFLPPPLGKWHQGHPLDLNDEYIREDRSYNEAQVEREALQGEVM